MIISKVIPPLEYLIMRTSQQPLALQPLTNKKPTKKYTKGKENQVEAKTTLAKNVNELTIPYVITIRGEMNILSTYQGRKF